MKVCNLVVNGEIHLGLSTPYGVVDASGTGLSMEALIAGADRAPLERLLTEGKAESVQNPVFGNVVKKAEKPSCPGNRSRSSAAFFRI